MGHGTLSGNRIIPQVTLSLMPIRLRAATNMLAKGTRKISGVSKTQLRTDAGDRLVTAAKQMGGVNQAAFVAPAEDAQARIFLEQCREARR